MALRSMVKIFYVGREVHVVRQHSSGFYFTQHGVVTGTVKGGIIVTLDVGITKRYSPNDRFLNVTKEECDYMCNMLNEYMERGEYKHGLNT